MFDINVLLYIGLVVIVLVYLCDYVGDDQVGDPNQIINQNTRSKNSSKSKDYPVIQLVGNDSTRDLYIWTVFGNNYTYCASGIPCMNTTTHENKK